MARHSEIRCGGRHKTIRGGPNDGKNIEYLIGKSDGGILKMKLRSNVGHVEIAMKKGTVKCSCGNEITWDSGGDNG